MDGIDTKSCLPLSHGNATPRRSATHEDIEPELKV